jgi:hypothetical protein
MSKRSILIVEDEGLADIHLAGALDGIAAAQQIHRECQIPMLFLTMHFDPDMNCEWLLDEVHSLISLIQRDGR